MMKTLAKRSLSTLLAVLMLFSIMAVSFTTTSAATNFVKGDTIYFRSNSQWSSGSPRFAAYFFEGDNKYKWVNLIDSDNDSFYEVTVPDSGYSNVIICRMIGSTSENNWSNVMNKTPDLEFDGKNDCYELTGGEWDGSGSWSVYAEKLVYFVNTKDWTKVAAYCTNYSSAGDTWPGKLCKVIDADKGIYAVYPGNYPSIVFTDYTENGESTAHYDYSAVKGKYIEPITGSYFNTADEAFAASKISIAGSFNDWQTNKDLFVKSSGNVYKASLTLAAGTYTFKIVQNGLWYGNGKTVTDSVSSMGLSFSDGDCALIASGGQYDFYFDSSKKTLKIEYTKKDIATDSEAPTVALSGSFNNWVSNDVMTASADSTVVTKTLSLEQGEYYFSIVENGLWYGDNSAVFIDTTENAVMHINGGACTLRTSGGDYTFRYNYSSNNLTITAVTKADPADLTNVSLSGDFNDWSTTATTMKKASSDTVTATVDLKAGNYTFKVVQDALWYGNTTTIVDQTSSALTMSMSKGNCTLQASGGKYTFTYNVSTRALSVSFESNGEDPAQTAVVAVVGDFNNWNKTENKLTYNGTTNTVSTTVRIPSGVYNLKIVDGDLWYGRSAAIKNSVSSLSLASTGGNCTLTATGGLYTFTYNVVNKKLAIAYAATTTAPAEDAVVSLAGSFNDWSSTATKMTMVNDYEVAATIKISSGVYNFKVVDGASWYGRSANIMDTVTALALSNTGSDCILYAGGGEYTFTYDVVGHTLSIDFVPSDEDPATSASVSLAGEFNEWSLSTNVMKFSGKNTVSATMDLVKGSYKFKVVHDNLWYGNNGTIKDTTTTTSDVGWQMSAFDGECTLNATGGKYTFTYNVISNHLSVTALISDPALNSDAVIAGSFNDWSTSATPFTYSSANIVSKTIELSKGTHYFKIVEDGLWYGNGETIVNSTDATKLSAEKSDCVLEASGGKYTFSYDVVKKELTITSVLDDPAKNTDVSIAGDFNGWDLNANKFTYESNDIVTTTVTLDAGTYYFKIVEDGLWFGNNGTIKDSTIDTSNTGWTMSMYDGDCTFVATGGVYTFTYKVSTNSLFVSHKRVS